MAALSPLGMVRNGRWESSGSLSEKADGRDTALATLRKADPVIAALIDANPDYDPDAWLAQLPKMRELAARFVDGRLDPEELERLPDEEVVARLTEVSGVGRWTAEGFLAIALRREDVVLPGDLALRKAIKRAYGLDHLPSQAEVVAIAEAWRPHRSLAVNYLFASVYGA
jgi:DNA-3-methyladenine glycosylase II